jgi:hypothetical protein
MVQFVLPFCFSCDYDAGDVIRTRAPTKGQGPQPCAVDQAVPPPQEQYISSVVVRLHQDDQLLHQLLAQAFLYSQVVPNFRQ